MTEENKELVRKDIAKRDDWVITDGILGKPISSLARNKKCEVIYSDMNGWPCKCHAICKYNMGFYFLAIDGQAEGHRISGVIAYRILEVQ